MNARPEPAPLAGLRFSNRLVRALPGDPEPANFRRQVRGACYSMVAPTQVRAPRLLAASREVADLLDLDPAECRTPLFAEVFAGNRLLPEMQPHATRYGGHQFGNWAGQLGDGRAINLGEIVNRRGEHWTLQLKGAGPTPYSRGADGLAVLRSSLREYLCSEAMHHLGVPTTRALSLITTGEDVVRDMFYDGHPAAEPGAVVCRVAPSFTRFGHFEILAASGEIDLLRQFVEFTLATDFPDFAPAPDAAPTTRRAHYLAWFGEVCRRTARLMVEWLRVGFVHGVMNTDNMSILGLTIDYGPYGWLENYDPDWTPNTTDAHGRRYRYGQQPQVALWNLVQLANALHPLIDDVAPLEQALADYGTTFDAAWADSMAAKLGWASFDAARDRPLVEGLLALLGAVETDMTLFYRALGRLDMDAAAGTDASALLAHFADAYYVPAQLDQAYRDRLVAWLGDYRARARLDGLDTAARRAGMERVNPCYVLRNYLAQLAIDRAAAGDPSYLEDLHEVLRRPYVEQPGKDAYCARRPEWARQRAGCSMLSCSS